MSVWYGPVLKTLRDSGLFIEISLIGAKVRASLSETSFLDIHFDPTTGSYSYALIDLTTPYPGDKRVLGWDGTRAWRRCVGYPAIRIIFSGARQTANGFSMSHQCEVMLSEK